MRAAVDIEPDEKRRARAFPARHASTYGVVKLRAELGETSEPRTATQKPLPTAAP